MSIGLCKPAAMGLHVKAAGSGNPVGGAGDAGRSVGGGGAGGGRDAAGASRGRVGGAEGRWVGGGGAVGCSDAAVASGAWIATVGGASPAGSVDGISEQANNSGTEAIRTRRTGRRPRLIELYPYGCASGVEDATKRYATRAVAARPCHCEEPRAERGATWQSHPARDEIATLPHALGAPEGVKRQLAMTLFPRGPYGR